MYDSQADRALGRPRDREFESWCSICAEASTAIDEGFDLATWSVGDGYLNASPLGAIFLASVAWFAHAGAALVRRAHRFRHRFLTRD